MNPRMGYLLALLLGAGIGWGLKSLSHAPQQSADLQMPAAPELAHPQSSSEVADTPASTSSLTTAETSKKPLTLKEKAAPAEAEKVQSQGMLEVAQTFAEQKDFARENAQAEIDFSRDWQDQEEDWQMQTQISDFLALHPKAAQIQLHSTRCNTKGCQLVGKAEFDHKVWDAVLEEMKVADWWDFTGTTSHSSSDGDNTKFVLYLER
ncbi:hypothetical protein P2G88_19225 [Aliiglaciecola sp. CAU 1673]|uniref:hypothetical protein n=1 Tax=Aliiglaciecola sp. CAU 1673 TaxID=3032595 RepID=UPI0023DB4B1E|nr:hypothetical protein [Aliiglaciecola sp. CAU 1673]MDF2180396.1 hypothetical protein [Aliiglaciecola sp. CAU 1673]